MPTKSKTTGKKSTTKKSTAKKDDNPTIAQTIKRIKGELKDDGSAKINIADEAGGSSDFAESILHHVATHAGIKIKTRVYKKTVSAQVVTED